MTPTPPGERLGRSGIRRGPGRGLLLAAALLTQPLAGHAQTVEELNGLTIEQLGEIQVTSVSKTPQSLSDAPAAICM